MRKFIVEGTTGHKINEVEATRPDDLDKWGSYTFRPEEYGGVDADWKWAHEKNPFPGDKVKSTAAFCLMMHQWPNSTRITIQEFFFDEEKPSMLYFKHKVYDSVD